MSEVKNSHERLGISEQYKVQALLLWKSIERNQNVKFTDFYLRLNKIYETIKGDLDSTNKSLIENLIQSKTEDKTRIFDVLISVFKFPEAASEKKYDLKDLETFLLMYLDAEEAEWYTLIERIDAILSVNFENDDCDIFETRLKVLKNDIQTLQKTKSLEDEEIITRNEQIRNSLKNVFFSRLPKELRDVNNPRIKNLLSQIREILENHDAEITLVKRGKTIEVVWKRIETEQEKTRKNIQLTLIQGGKPQQKNKPKLTLV